MQTEIVAGNAVFNRFDLGHVMSADCKFIVFLRHKELMLELGNNIAKEGETQDHPHRWQ